MKQFKHKTLLARASKMLLAMLCFACFGVAKAQTVVYSEGFENMSSAEDLTAAGWIFWGATGGYIGIETSYVNTGSKALNINAWDCSNSSDNEVAGLPILSNPINTLQITFSYRQRSGGNVKVGYLTDANDASTFVELETLPSSTSGYSTATVDLSAAPATAARIAIEQFKWYECYIDDIEVSLRSTCATPTNLAVNYTSGATTATVTWSGEASSYNIDVNGTVTNGVTSPYTINNLQPTTTYTVKLQSDCGEEQSGWVSTSFFSGCPDTYPIPYAYGFEDAGAIECWTISGGDGYSSIYDNEWSESNVGYNAARTGDNYFMFYYTETPPQYLISPQLSGIENGLHVEFYYRQYEQGVETFQVGYSTSDNAPASFTWGNEITASTSYQRFSANYPKETKYVAIKHTSNDEYLLYIDDFLFEESASCLEPSGLTISGATTTGATLSWTAGGSETAWDIFVTDDATVVPGEATTPTISGVDANTYNLTALNPCTIYYVYVRSACSSTDASAWSSPVIFHTECEPMALPYSYDFEDDDLPVSWSTIVENTSYTGINLMSTTETNQVLAFYMGTYQNPALIAVLPEVDVANYPLNRYQITFDACYARTSSSSMTAGKLAIGIMTDPTDASTFELVEEVDITDGYSTFGSHTVWLNSYTGNGHYIALKDIYTQSGYVLVDNVAVTALPSCLSPTDLAVSNFSDTSVDLSWTANGGENKWTVYYKKATDESYTEVPDVTDNPYTLSGLEAATAYQFYVVANCSETDESDPSEVYSFITDCGAIASLPWTENFDSYTGSTSSSVPSGYPNDEMPNCWRFLNRSETSSAYPLVFVSSFSGYPVSGNCLFFRSSSTTPLYAVLPAFAEDIAGLQLTFTYRNEGTTTYNGTLIVGYMTDPTNAATFTAVLTCDRTTTLTEKEVMFTDAPTGSYIAFMYQGGSSNNYYMSIDNVTVNIKPSCFKPTELSATNITENSAVLSWTPGGSETSWMLNYREVGEEEWIENSVTGNPSYTLTDLTAQTTYEFYVVASCSDTDTSEPSNTYTFTTKCAAIADFPWSEDFEDYNNNTLVDCWDNSASTSSTLSSYPERIWGVYSYSDNKMIRMYNYFVQSGTALINTPRIVLPSEGEYYLTFDYAHNADCGAFAVKVSTDNGTTFTELASYAQGSGSSYSNPGEFTPATISLADYAGKAIILQFFANANYGNGAIFVDNVRVGSPIEKIKFAKEGYATYYNSGYDVVLPAGMKAKIVTASASDGTLTYQTIDGNVPAGTAVMLQVAPTEAAQTLIVELATATTGSYTGNKLHGSDAGATTTGDTGDDLFYKLSYDEHGENIGWYWGKADGAAFESAPHKAWLALSSSVFPPSQGAPFLGLPGWEDTTGIVPVGVNPEDGEWYTLQGLKIGKKPTTAGVYIHNGKKVLIP